VNDADVERLARAICFKNHGLTEFYDSPRNPYWRKRYRAEARRILAVLPDAGFRFVKSGDLVLTREEWRRVTDPLVEHGLHIPLADIFAKLAPQEGEARGPKYAASDAQAWRDMEAEAEEGEADHE
jgi:hypothetical protein